MASTATAVARAGVPSFERRNCMVRVSLEGANAVARPAEEPHLRRGSYIGLLEPGEEPRGTECEQSNPQLEQSVNPKRVGKMICAPSDQPPEPSASCVVTFSAGSPLILQIVATTETTDDAARSRRSGDGGSRLSTSRPGLDVSSPS